MKRKLLITLVVVLAVIFVLCLSYLLALADAQADLADKNAESETEDTGFRNLDENTTTATPEIDNTGTSAQTTTEPSEETSSPTQTNTTEPTEEVTASTTETTAPSVDQTEATDDLDQNELPIVPNG